MAADGDVDAIVVGVGSGGTLGGLSRYFADVSPQTEFVLADPAGSIPADYLDNGHIGEAGSWLVEGIGEDFVPPLSDFDGPQRLPHRRRRSLHHRARSAAQGRRAGGLVHRHPAGRRTALLPRTDRTKRVVTFVCDSGNKYLSKMYNDHWMLEQGLLSKPQHGDLRDLIAYRHDEGAAVSAAPDDTLAIVHARMRLYDISQLPVLEGDRVVGLIDEWDLLNAVRADAAHFSLPASSAMTKRVHTLQKAGYEELQATFNHGHVAVVLDGERFLGLITRTDVLNAAPKLR